MYSPINYKLTDQFFFFHFVQFKELQIGKCPISNGHCRIVSLELIWYRCKREGAGVSDACWKVAG